MGPYLTAAMTQQGVLSPEGSCKTFDSSADGFARADSINAVYIKRLDDAIRDGNAIRAVIRGTSTNSDGKSGSLMAPNGEAHEALMAKVYQDTGLDPRETAFVEVFLGSDLFLHYRTNRESYIVSWNRYCNWRPNW